MARGMCCGARQAVPPPIETRLWEGSPPAASDGPSAAPPPPTSIWVMGGFVGAARTIVAHRRVGIAGWQRVGGHDRSAAGREATRAAEAEEALRRAMVLVSSFKYSVLPGDFVIFPSCRVTIPHLGVKVRTFKYLISTPDSFHNSSLVFLALEEQ